MAGLLTGAAVSLTRHVLTDAISDGEAERTTDQKDNGEVGHPTTLSASRLQQACILKRGRSGSSTQHCGSLMQMSGPRVFRRQDIELERT